VTEVIRIGQPEITVALRRSARARRMTLRLSHATGLATLTLPRRVSVAEARRFAESQSGWLLDQIGRQQPRMVVGLGSILPLRGQELRLASAPGRLVRAEGGQLLVPGSAEGAGRRLAGWLKAQARADLTAASQRHADRLGCRFTAITLSDTRSRWGSCSAQGALMYSWRLVLAPSEVLDYVAAHEVAHLREMNHSPAFWQVVAALKPGFEQQRAWLRASGPLLHVHDFG
jgi:predicted metal-dependent hydrolase